MARPPELPDPGRGDTPGPQGPAPLRGRGRLGGGNYSEGARRLSRAPRMAPRAGRSRLGGWAGRASLGASPTPPGTGERGSGGRGRGGRGNAAASMLGTEGKLERRHLSLFKLAQLSERRPARSWPWGCVGPGARTPGGRAVSTPAHSLSARPGSGCREGSGARLARAGRPFQSQGGAPPGSPPSTPRPQRAGPPTPAPTLGPRPRAPVRSPLTRSQDRASRLPPLRPPPLPPPARGSSRCLWGRRKRPQSKRSKSRRRRGRGRGPVDSPGGGADTKRAVTAPGVARGL